ncbi:MAG: tetratricopeptide repeat protein [Gallionella sp.]
MSVINQVLNQLEQRGAHHAARQPLVHAVSRTRRDFIVPVLAIVFALTTGVAAWQWMLPSKSAADVEVVAAQGGISPSADEPENFMSAQPSIATDRASASDVMATETTGEPLVLTSKLSLELSSLPLPASLRYGSDHVVRPDSGNPIENSSPASNPEKVAQVPTSRPKSASSTTANSKAVASTSGNTAPIKQVSSKQRADAEFLRAVGLMQQGRIAGAISGYEATLRLEAGHEAARQALVALLLEGKRSADAEKVLQEGLNGTPEHTGFTMLLARLQVERGALAQAISTLEKSLPLADEQVDYRAFLAALLQRQNRNEEASQHYRIVLQHSPNNGIWLMGYGISLQALQRNVEAKEAFQRAFDTKTLTPELQAFVQQKLKEL